VAAQGIAVDGNGNVFATDTRSGRIQKFDEDGNFLYAFNESVPDSPRIFSGGGLALDGKDDLFAVDNRGPQRIAEFDKYGKLLGRWGGPGSDGAISFVGGLAVDAQGDLYVSDVTAGRGIAPRGHFAGCGYR